MSITICNIWGGRKQRIDGEVTTEFEIQLQEAWHPGQNENHRVGRKAFLVLKKHRQVWVAGGEGRISRLKDNDIKCRKRQTYLKAFCIEVPKPLPQSISQNLVSKFKKDLCDSRAVWFVQP